jgi:hypothetical protein
MLLLKLFFNKNTLVFKTNKKTMSNQIIKKLTVLLSIFCMALLFNTNIYAQKSKKSPAVQSEGTINETKVVVSYSQPSVKGRKVWGKLVKYDKVWRTGANEATTISFDKDVKIAGSLLKAGEYSFFTIPVKQGDWTIIFNKRAKQWGSFNYKEEEDALRIKVQAEENEHTEKLTFEVDEATAKIWVKWEGLKYGFLIENP